MTQIPAPEKPPSKKIRQCRQQIAKDLENQDFCHAFKLHHDHRQDAGYNTDSLGNIKFHG